MPWPSGSIPNGIWGCVTRIINARAAERCFAPVPKPSSAQCGCFLRLRGRVRRRPHVHGSSLLRRLEVSLGVDPNFSDTSCCFFPFHERFVLGVRPFWYLFRSGFHFNRRFSKSPAWTARGTARSCGPPCWSPCRSRESAPRCPPGTRWSASAESLECSPTNLGRLKRNHAPPPNHYPGLNEII